jgi:CBS domain-containing protein
MPDLSLHKKAQCLRIYIGESDRWRGKALEVVLLETIRAQGLAGATVFRGVAGFGAHSRIHTTGIEALSMDLPVVIELIDTPEKINAAIDVIYPMVREGLITMEEVNIVKYTHRFLNPLPADRLVSEVMTRNVVTLNPDMSVQEAWKRMLEKAVKAMPVVDPGNQVVGILTDEDLLERAGIQQRLSLALRMEKGEIKQELQKLGDMTLHVKDVMTRAVVTVLTDETLGVGTTRMVKTGLKRLPVVDENGKLVGILSRLDILRQAASAPMPELPAHLVSRAVRTVKDIMNTHIPMLHEDDDLEAIIQKFAMSDSHRLVVVNSEGVAIGLISDSDVIMRIQPARHRNILDALRQVGKPPTGEETAFDLMSKGPLTALSDLPVVEAAKKMLAESRKWLVVVDEKGIPLGIVDRKLLLESITSILPSE